MNNRQRENSEGHRESYLANNFMNLNNDLNYISGNES